jgi:hypothetical protein
MIDFTPSQLTWIVIGACSIGGTGYISINSKFEDIDKKVEIVKVSTDNTKDEMKEIKAALLRIEDKMYKSQQGSQK